MFLLDNLLTAPGKAMLFLFEEMAKKAQEEWLDDSSIKEELQELYSLLDAGRVEEKEFEEREQRLLARLEQIANIKLGNQRGVPTGELEVSYPEEAIEGEPDAPATSAALVVQPPRTLGSNEQISRSAGESILRALRPYIESALHTSISQVESANAEPIVEYGCSVRPLFEDEVLPVDALPSAASPPIIEVPASATEQQIKEPRPPHSGTRLSREESPTSASSTDRRSASAPAEPPREPPRREPKVEPLGPKVQMSEVVDNAVRVLSITKLRVSSVTSVAKTSEGWRVSVELIERASVPDTSDLLGVYEVKLDDCGVVTGYERIRVRRRNDLRA